MHRRRRSPAPTNVKRDVGSDAWQLAALLGADRRRRVFPQPESTPKPYRHRRRGLGPVELVARYAEQSIDDAAFAGAAANRLGRTPTASAREARNAGIGVNWYFSRNFKIQVNYDQTAFEGGAAGGRQTLPDEKAIVHPLPGEFLKRIPMHRQT